MPDASHRTGVTGPTARRCNWRVLYGSQGIHAESPPPYGITAAGVRGGDVLERAPSALTGHGIARAVTITVRAGSSNGQRRWRSGQLKQLGRTGRPDRHTDRRMS
ncbi:hypothetical protein [Streptomyces sp. NPDC088847]|uniref:hypothetical protein n=1 Tax=Streptomyces sp. NPDC088847 TaxID=3365909 RepID=UPI00380DB7B7